MERAERDQRDRRDQRLRAVMAAMAAGDRGATFDLYAEFGTPIKATIRRMLRRVGVESVPAEELDGLVIDACLELQACADSWDPEGGATPWVWAERRLLGVVSRWIGQHADPLDDRRGIVVDLVAAAPGPANEPNPVELLARIDDPTCRLLLEALETVATARDRSILLEVGLQRSLGDTSPAVTVGPEVGLRPDAVRQVLRRVRRRLHDLAALEPRYASLADLALLAV